MRLKCHKATARMTATQTTCVIGTPLAISYGVIYIAAALCAWAVGDDALVETIQVFITAHLQTQFPLLLLLAIALFICVLANSLEFGAIWGALPGTTALQNSSWAFPRSCKTWGARSGVVFSSLQPQLLQSPLHAPLHLHVSRPVGRRALTPP